jgi:hypothetical protein
MMRDADSVGHSRRSGRYSRQGMHNNSVAATSCTPATLFEKSDDIEFLPLGGHIVIRGFRGVACLAVQSGSS